MQLCGSTGDYGRRLSATVIGFGATARGAVTALKALGIHDVRVLTHRAIAAVGSPIPSVDIVHFEHSEEYPFESTVTTDGGPVRIGPYLAESDIVVNCTLQDPNAPLTYLHTDDLGAFRHGSLIVDVSVDEGMGFTWARPTSFAEPMITVGESTHYYAIDHSPSLLWNATTWELSKALMPFLRVVMEGPSSWAESDTIRRAIEIEEGHIRNEAILTFQGRSAQYPYPSEATAGA
jgi:alanine dehydrogenase